MLSGILESHRAAGEFVGAGVAVQGPDGSITEVASGTQSVDPASAPVDLDVPWNVGSATKVFVAVVALQLADEGRLDLDAGIERYLPELPGADRITPRQLLQHTTGLNEYLNDPAVRSEATREWAPAELVAVAEAAGRVGEPCGPFQYSNTNYIVLGEIIEQVTGNPWGDEVVARIAEPLGMTSTRELSPEDRPGGYQVIDGALVDWTHGAHPSIGGAAGGLQSTVRDLLRFAKRCATGHCCHPSRRPRCRPSCPARTSRSSASTTATGSVWSGTPPALSPPSATWARARRSRRTSATTPSTAPPSPSRRTRLSQGRRRSWPSRRSLPSARPAEPTDPTDAPSRRTSGRGRSRFFRERPRPQEAR